MDADERRRRGALLCAQLAGAAAAVTPPGIEHSSEAWELTASTDADFAIKLTAWEADPNPATRDRLKAAYCAALDAWRAAGARFAPLRPTGNLRPGGAP